MYQPKYETRGKNSHVQKSCTASKIPRTHRIENSLFARDEKEDRSGEERKKERGGGREWINQPCVETIARAGEPGHQDRNAPR